MRIPAWLGPIVAIDLRALAAVRVGLAGVVLADLAIRAPDLEAFAGEAGILPRAERLRLFGPGTALSMWDAVASSPVAGQALVAAVALAAVALALGYRTRLATLVCWLAVQGFACRMPPISTGGDVLLAALLLWGLFLPLGARASLDALRRPPATPPPAQLASLASAIWVTQVAGMMVLSGLAKLADPTWRAGDGVHYALHAEFYATPLAHALRDATWLTGPLNWAVLGFEIGGAAVLLVPWRRDALRLAYAGALVAMNLSFWLCLRVGIFSWVAMIGALVFVPAGAWDWLGRRVGSGRRLAARLARLARPPRDRPAPPLWAIRAVLIVLAAGAVLGNLDPRVRRVVPAAVDHAVRALVLEQRGWPMFAPTARDHGWFVIPARLTSGAVVDLHAGGAPVDEAAPALLSADFPSYRWRKLYFNLRRSPALRQLHAAYLCRAWNAGHAAGEQVVSLELVYLKRDNLPGGALGPVRRVVMLAHRCGATAAVDREREPPGGD